MSNQQTVELLNAVVFYLFTGLLFGAATSTAVRSATWSRAGVEPPRLLVRDLVTTTGLATSFLAILFARVVELPEAVTRSVPWTVFSALPALVGIGVYLYFELAVIGHHPVEPLPPPDSARQEEQP